MAFSLKISRVGKPPTSWSLAKIPDFGLYAKPSSRGRTLPLSPTKADGLIVVKSINKVELLSPPSSSFSFLPLSVFPSMSPLPHWIWSNLLKWDVPSLPHVTSPLALLDFPLSSYPILWISILSSCDTCPTSVPLRLLFQFLSILHMAPYEPSNMCQVSFVTLGALENMKF